MLCFIFSRTTAKKLRRLGAVILTLYAPAAFAEDGCIVAYEQEERFYCPEKEKHLSDRDFAETIIAFFSDKVPEEYRFENVDEAVRRIGRQAELTEKSFADMIYVCRDPLEDREIRNSNWLDRLVWSNQLVIVGVEVPSRNSGDPILYISSRVDKCGYDYDYSYGLIKWKITK